MDIKDIEKLTELARIDLSEDEKQTLLKDLGKVVAYVETIKEANVDDINVDSELYNVWREDEVKDKEFSKELILKQFPDAQDGFLKVKKIL
jgi:aspartyl-tRNA(Asn)/glutamyl-tRNA(Gln) amidotransferase subunit C